MVSTPVFSTTYYITVRTVKTGMTEARSGMFGFQAVWWWNLTEYFLTSPGTVPCWAAGRGVNVVAAGALGAIVAAGGVGTTLGEYQV